MKTETLSQKRARAGRASIKARKSDPEFIPQCRERMAKVLEMRKDHPEWEEKNSSAGS